MVRPEVVGALPVTSSIHSTLGFKFSVHTGLEFPACQQCNNETGRSDLVAAMLARVMPHADSSVHRKDLTKILSAVSNNAPGLLREMNVSRGAEKLARKQLGIPEDMHPLRADGPILSAHILTFAAKLGFALHYEVNGTPIPVGGGAQVIWFSNVQAMRGQIPQELFSLLPSPATLQQGRKTAGEQFQYSFARGEREHMLYFASFSQSSAVAGVAATDRSIWLEANADRFPIFRPGSFGRRVRGESAAPRRA